MIQLADSSTRANVTNLQVNGIFIKNQNVRWLDVSVGDLNLLQMCIRVNH